MVCPRCQGECDATSTVCPRCAAPLLLGEDPPPAALDRLLALDRRRWERLQPGPPAESTPAATSAPIPVPDLMELGWTETPRALDLPSEVTPSPVETEPGRVARWRRAAAWAVDLAVVALFAATPLAIAGGLDAGSEATDALLPHAAAFAAVLAFAYGTVAQTLTGATAGKRLLGLQVIGPGGGPPGLARSAARTALAVLGGAALGLPAVIALFTPSGRALHDIAAGTSVVPAP